MFPVLPVRNFRTADACRKLRSVRSQAIPALSDMWVVASAGVVLRETCRLGLRAGRDGGRPPTVAGRVARRRRSRGSKTFVSYMTQLLVQRAILHFITCTDGRALASLVWTSTCQKCTDRGRRSRWRAACLHMRPPGSRNLKSIRVHAPPLYALGSIVYTLSHHIRM